MHLTPEDILNLFDRLGDRQYPGESVSLLEHAWQCGHLARKSGAPVTLQLASWLHDLGHLCNLREDILQPHDEVDHHEMVGAQIIQPFWGDEVAEPIRLHVMAKRYLVTTRSQYQQKLSNTSLHTLSLQGGHLTIQEISNFEKHPFFKSSLLLRIWDELGKKTGWFDISRHAALNHLRMLMDALPLHVCS